MLALVKDDAEGNTNRIKHLLRFRVRADPAELFDELAVNVEFRRAEIPKL